MRKLMFIISMICSVKPAFGKTTISGFDETSTRLTLDSRDYGVVKDLFELGKEKYGIGGGGGYSSMQQHVGLPNAKAISRLGHSSVPGKFPNGDIGIAYEHYQISLNFNFVHNDYALITKRGQKTLEVFGSVADELIDLGLGEVKGVSCVRKRISVCRIALW